MVPAVAARDRRGADAEGPDPLVDCGVMARRSRAPLLLLAALVPVLACGPTAEEEAARVKPQLQRLLEEYLPALAAAYTTGDTGGLAGLAAPKEVAAVEHRIVQLAQEGRRLRPRLQTFTIEEVTVWNRVNAFATTFEVWDLEVLAAGSETVLSEASGRRDRVTYQLKREDGRWQVLYREIRR